MNFKNRLMFFGWGIILIWLSCTLSPQKTIKSGDQHRASRPVLTGWLTESQLLSQVPGYQIEKDQYQPDLKALEPLKTLAKDVQVIVFLGTWCPDSQREVPRFLKITGLTQNPHITVKMLGLDRTKRDPDGVAEASDIQFVPTFVVFQEGAELGRIVEQPMASLEYDLAEIFALMK